LTIFRRLGFILLALLLGGMMLFWNEIPRWRTGGSTPVAAASVTWGKDLLECPANTAAITFFGDSHVSGERSGPNARPFGSVLEQQLSGKAKVTLHGVGGDTSLMGEQRWLRGMAGGDLVILAFGSNDAAPRGWMRGKRAVAIADFKQSLQRQIDHWRGRGARVALLAAPPGGSAAIMARVVPYREATLELGKANQVAVLDPGDAFATCKSGPPILGYDALHMTAAGHACLGTWLAKQVCPGSD
jgi:lysophospholipase L1-like esterase